MKIITKLIDDDGKVRKSGTIYVDKPLAWSAMEFMEMIGKNQNNPQSKEVAEDIVGTHKSMLFSDFYKIFNHISKQSDGRIRINIMGFPLTTGANGEIRITINNDWVEPAFSNPSIAEIVQHIMYPRNKIRLKELYELYLATTVLHHVSKKEFTKTIVRLGYAKWCGCSNVRYISKEQRSSIQKLNNEQIQEFTKSYIEEHGVHGKVVAAHLFNAWQQIFEPEKIHNRRQFYAYLQSIGYTKKRGSGNNFYISGYKFREGSGT